MTNYLKEGDGGDLNPISEIGERVLREISEHEYELIDVWCICCRQKKQIPWIDPHYRNNFICPECEKNHKAEAEAKKTEAQKQQDILRLGGLRAYNNFTLEKFTKKDVIELCKDFPNVNLFLWGSSGTGKTHLATALIRKFPEGEVWKPQEIYRTCRGKKDGDEEQEIINNFVNKKYIIIDDLGVDKKTDFSFSTLYEIIDGRYMDEKTGMIVTSNLSLSALAERLNDDRISSRLAGMCKIINIIGDDWRLKNGQT